MGHPANKQGMISKLIGNPIPEVVVEVEEVLLPDLVSEVEALTLPNLHPIMDRGRI